MDWNDLSPWLLAIAAVFGPAAGYWVRGLVGRAAASEVDRVLDGKLAAFRAELVKEINGTYVRTKECELTHKGTLDQIGQILQTLKQLQASIDELRGRPWPAPPREDTVERNKPTPA